MVKKYSCVFCSFSLRTKQLLLHICAAICNVFSTELVLISKCKCTTAEPIVFHVSSYLEYTGVKEKKVPALAISKSKANALLMLCLLWELLLHLCMTLVHNTAWGSMAFFLPSARPRLFLMSRKDRRLSSSSVQEVHLLRVVSVAGAEMGNCPVSATQQRNVLFSSLL